jgi:phage tail protein X
MELTPYPVEEGERWDTVAYKAYGDATQTYPIILANPGVLLNTRLEAGVVLMIPILSLNDNIALPAEKLPPWKQ